MASAFTIKDQTFRQIPTVGSGRVWRCDAKNIWISERTPLHGARDFSARRGSEFLQRRGEYVRRFISPEAAASAALTQWD